GTSQADIHVLHRRFGSVAGTVRDAASRETIPFANVSMNPPSIPASVITDLDGHYLLDAQALPFPGTQPLAVAVTASPPLFSGYWPGTASGFLNADQTSTLDVDVIKVCTSATIVGTVVNAITGAPIAGATVSMSSPQQTFSTLTDASGAFTLSQVTVGTNNSPQAVQLTASAPGFLPQQQTVTVFCGATINVDFGQPSTVSGSIRGHVTNLDTGSPLANVFVGS